MNDEASLRTYAPRLHDCAHSAILDGEVCCLNPDGSSNFYDLLSRTSGPFFLAFDLLALDGEDLRAAAPRAQEPIAADHALSQD